MSDTVWPDAQSRPVDPDEPASLVEPQPPVEDPEEYSPGLVYPDAEHADVADVVDQGTEVPADLSDEP